MSKTTAKKSAKKTAKKDAKKVTDGTLEKVQGGHGHTRWWEEDRDDYDSYGDEFL